VRRIKPPCAELHVLAPQRKCSYGCGALVWAEEGSVCCSAGKHILGPEYNPPIDDGYWEILKLEHISKDSRHLNAALAMGTQGVFPPKAMGGLAWHEQGNKWAHLALFGTAYLRMLPLSSNNAFDSHMLPDNLLVDGAAMDLGRDYAERLLRTRTYLRDNHPLASCLHAIADVPGERVDLNPFMRIEAQSPAHQRLEAGLCEQRRAPSCWSTSSGICTSNAMLTMGTSSRSRPWAAWRGTTRAAKGAPGALWHAPYLRMLPLSRNITFDGHVLPDDILCWKAPLVDLGRGATPCACCAGERVSGHVI
jgi:hypothetical protein